MDRLTTARKAAAEAFREIDQKAMVDRFLNGVYDDDLIVKACLRAIDATIDESHDLRSGEYLARVIEERDRYREALETLCVRLEPLCYRAGKWTLNSDSARVSVRLGDLRAARAALEANNEPA